MLEALDDYGALHEGDIAAEARLPAPAARRAIASLVARGVVHRMPDGRWYHGEPEPVTPAPTRRRPPRWPVERAVYAYVKARPGVPVRQAVREVAAARGSVREAIQRLQALGWVAVDHGCAWATS